jgi:transcriptional regulator with XRE-family HTH domain
MVNVKFQKRLGGLLLHLRKEAGLSQEELAKRSHITRQHLQRLENGTANPTLETLLNLAKATGRNLSELIRAAE